MVSEIITYDGVTCPLEVRMTLLDTNLVFLSEIVTASVKSLKRLPDNASEPRSPHMGGLFPLDINQVLQCVRVM